MCAQCAFVALAAIGTYSAFHNQIRARIDKTLGIDDAELTSIAPEGAELATTAPQPLTSERSVTLAVFLLVLSQLRHHSEPQAVAESPPPTVWDGELFPGAASTGG